MGEKKKRLQTFKDQHPVCCFCNGSAVTETIEHAPPRIFMVGSQRPKGLEFPACRRCNGGTSHLDQAVSFIAYSGGLENLIKNNSDAHWDKVFKGVANNYPEVIGYLTGPSSPKKVNLKGSMREVVEVSFDPRLRTEWVFPWIAKMGFALWYEHSGCVADEDLWLQPLWLTNCPIIKDPNLPARLFPAGFHVVPFKQGRNDFSSQFHYRFAINHEHRLGAFFLCVHDATIFMAIVFDAKLREKLVMRPNDFEVFHCTPDGIKSIAQR